MDEDLWHGYVSGIAVVLFVSTVKLAFFFNTLLGWLAPLTIILFSRRTVLGVKKIVQEVWRVLCFFASYVPQFQFQCRAIDVP